MFITRAEKAPLTKKEKAKATQYSPCGIIVAFQFGFAGLGELLPRISNSVFSGLLYV